ncbi:MAG: dehydratase [Candidatus Helarchaeota archaeon]|nr:dehydratase [Candidatus Helarchaeota archaeon]
MIGKYFNEFNVGDKFLTSRRTLTEYDLEAFCNLVWFNSSMFFDDIYAKEEMPYKSRVFPGPFIIPLAVGLFLKLGFYERTIIALLGIQNMKFKAPLRIGDTMQVDVEILDKKDSKTYPDRGILIVQFIVNKALSKSEKEFIMSFEMTHMLKKR